MAGDADAVLARRQRGWRASGGGPQPRYCFAALRHLVGRLIEHDARWERALATAPVLQVTYEELTADLPRAIRRTLDHIGVPLPDDRAPATPGMRRQADALSDAWVEAYARDAAADPGREQLATPT